MVKQELAPGIMLYKNVFSDANQIIESIKEAVKSKTIDWSIPYINNGEINYIDREIRDVDVFGVKAPTEDEESFEKRIHESISDKDIFDFYLGKTLKNIFEECLQDYKFYYRIDNFLNFDLFQILRYGNGQHFENHIDDSILFHRRISMSYYLNNDFNGGEIEFPRFNVKYKPEGNDFLIFPSTYVYNHIVHPVSDGIRYAVVNWVH
jgi:hypothetical protein